MTNNMTEREELGLGKERRENFQGENGMRADDGQSPARSSKKPKVKFVGQDGNVFNLIGIARRALVKAGQPEQAKQMTTEVMQQHSYGEALATMMKYVEVS